MKSWPFIEAQKILNRSPNKKEVIFETGYGPSGLPHIGTFAEVVRTTMVMNALKELDPTIKTKLIAFSDDMDALRKIPDNIPDSDRFRQYIGKPLTDIPDPFGTHSSYGEHMNSVLCKFLDLFEFKYDLKSSTKCYKSGLFNEKLILLLENYDKVMKIMLPSLGEERQRTYSPFLPICPETGKVLQVSVEVNSNDKTITYRNENNNIITSEVTNGKCKLQWKADWGMRWAALGVDYEMHGKDLTPSAKLSTQICSILGKTPQLFVYEFFLDIEGKKVSKSKGNGLTIEEWLSYAPKESLSLYMFQQPHRAKRLYFDVIPKSVDEYISFVNSYDQDKDNPAWHVHNGNVPKINSENISFNLLLNVASACNPENKQVLWGFIKNYKPNITPETHKIIDELASYAVKYYHDFVETKKKYKIPNKAERKALMDLKQSLSNLNKSAASNEIQKCVFSVGKQHYEKIGEWFRTLYTVLIGQEQGPKIGSFFALYGLNKSIQLIEDKINQDEG